LIFNRRKSYIGIWVFLVLSIFGFGENQNTSSIRIFASGDTMLGSWAEMVIADSGYAYPFQKLQDFTADADIFFTNLEAPFGTTGETFEKEYTFRVKPDLVNVLLAGKINLVSLANNHIMDFGISALRETMQVLEKHQIFYAGAGLNLSEARKPAIFEIKGKKFGFLAYSLTFPEEFWASDSTPGTCFPYDTFAFKDVAALDKEVDFVIVSCHWSQELLEYPKKYQIDLAHRLINNGADLILGHHPHVLQGIEWYKGKLIAYSLGNFIFGSYSEKAKESMLLKITLQPNDSIIAQVLPIKVYNKEVEFRPVPLNDEEKQAFIYNLAKLSLELNPSPIGINSEGIINWKESSNL
jgi:poly-gamma-glutamate synthesis protein (capsule biosynthesis protein)